MRYIRLSSKYGNLFLRKSKFEGVQFIQDENGEPRLGIVFDATTIAVDDTNKREQKGSQITMPKRLTISKKKLLDSLVAGFTISKTPFRNEKLYCLSRFIVTNIQKAQGLLRN